MKIQKIFVEVYVDDSVNVADWLDERLGDSDEVSYRYVTLISEEETEVTHPEQYEEDIVEAIQAIDDFIADRELEKCGIDLTPLKKIAADLSGDVFKYEDLIDSRKRKKD